MQPNSNNHANRCVLQSVCSIANTAECSPICPSYIAMHGLNGEGGRSGASNMPKAYRLVTLVNSPARADQAEVYKVADQYAATFIRQFEGEARIKSLYLFSREPGTGKTTTAAALLNEYLIVNYIGSIRRGLTPTDRPAYFFDVNEWQTDYNSFNRPRVPDSIAEPASARYYSAMIKAKSAPFIVMDDIGVRDCTEGFRGVLHDVINARVAGELPTVYTSNVPISELASIFDARLTDRIRDMCGELTFKGKSKRGMRKEVTQSEH